MELEELEKLEKLETKKEDASTMKASSFLPIDSVEPQRQ